MKPVFPGLAPHWLSSVGAGMPRMPQAIRVPLLRFFRFGVVGTINTGVYFGLYSVLCQVCFYLVSHAAAFLTAMVVSFFLNCSFTFRTRPTMRKFLLFPMSNAAGFVLQTVGLLTLVNVAGLEPAYAPLPAMAVSVPATYVVARIVLTDCYREARGNP